MITLTHMKQRGKTINGPVLKALRIRLGLNIAQAAAMLPVTPAMWSQWESGGRGISDKSLDKLVQLFGLHSEDALLAQSALDSITEADRQLKRRHKDAAA